MLQVRRPVAASAAAAALVAALACADGAAALPDPTDRSATLTGELVTVVDGPAKESRVRVAGGAFIPVPVSIQQATPGSTVTVTVSGNEQSTRPGVARRPEQPPSTSAATVVTSPAVARSVSPAVHQVTLVLGVPHGLAGPAVTATQARAQLQGASQYWSEQSGGMVSFAAATVSAPMTLAAPCTDYWGMWREATNRTGFVPGPNKHLALLLPRAAVSSGCSYGLASISPGVNAGGYAYVADVSWPVLAHELGHNLGLAHAERLLCPKTADAAVTALATASCTIKDYGDPWDVMAASSPNNAGSLSAPQAYRIGLLPSTAVQQVGSGSVTVTLGSVSSRAGVRAVRVVDPTTKVAYFVEYRTRTGRDLLLYAPMIDGVRVLREDTSATGDAKPSLALDATPTGGSADLAWGIPVGGSFRSYGGGVTVKVLSAANGTARLSVTAGTSPTAPRPATSPPSGLLVDLSPTTGSAASAGRWRAVRDGRYAFGTALTTSTSGATWSVVVDGGRSLDLIGTAFPKGARGRILVDGKAVAEFDSYRASTQTPYQQVLRSVALAAGRHTVTVVALPTAARPTLALDAFRLR